MATSEPEKPRSAIRSLIVAGVLLALAGVGGAIAARALKKNSPPPASKTAGTTDRLDLGDAQEDAESSPTYHWKRPSLDLVPPPLPPTKPGERDPF